DERLAVVEVRLVVAVAGVQLVAEDGIVREPVGGLLGGQVETIHGRSPRDGPRHQLAQEHRAGERAEREGEARREPPAPGKTRVRRYSVTSNVRVPTSTPLSTSSTAKRSIGHPPSQARLKAAAVLPSMAMRWVHWSLPVLRGAYWTFAVSEL